jgi:acyl-CoA thioesterase FadM
MNLYLRMLIIAFAARLRPRLGVFDESVLQMPVLPTDIDYWGHMNGGRCLTLSDLGRMDYFIRTGAFKVAREQKWVLPIGSLTMQFRRPLMVFSPYELRTRMLGWDDKWFYMESRFEHGGKLHARTVVRGLARGADGNVAPAVLLERLGLNQPSPELPADVRELVASAAAAPKE